MDRRGTACGTALRSSREVSLAASRLSEEGGEEAIMDGQPDEKPGDEVKPGTDQSGENICRTCAGSGQVNGRDCPDCRGTGTVTALVGDA